MYGFQCKLGQDIGPAVIIRSFQDAARQVLGKVVSSQKVDDAHLEIRMLRDQSGPQQGEHRLAEAGELFR